MGRVYCTHCGRVSCNNDENHAEKYGGCECGGSLEIFHSNDGKYLECDECFKRIDMSIQDSFGFVDGETTCAKCGEILRRDNCHWGMGGWWHNVEPKTELDDLRELCESMFTYHEVQKYAGANYECFYCGTMRGSGHATECAVVKYNKIKEKYDTSGE